MADAALQPASKPLFSREEIRALLIPLLVEMSLTLIIGVVDSIMVAAAGEAAVSAVSMVDTVIQLVLFVFAALASGGAVVAGQYLGKGDPENARRAANELVWLNGAFSLVVLALAYILSHWISGSLYGDVEPIVEQHALTYLIISASSIPAIALFEAGTAIFRTMGNAKVTMLVSLFMNIINALVNAILIYGAGLGVAGAAIGSVVARWLGAVLILSLLMQPQVDLGLEMTLRHRFDLDMSKRILYMGAPNGIENALFQMGKIMLISLAARFGTEAITANAVTQALAGIQMIPGSAVQLALTTVIARCVGAREFDQARMYNKRLHQVTYAMHLVVTAVLLLLLPLIFRAYGLSDETAQIARSMINWNSAGIVTLWPISFVLPVSLRAAGDVRFPMAISVFSMWTFRIGGAWLLAYPLGFGAVGVWMATVGIDWVFRSTVFVLRWRSRVWESMAVV